MTETHIAAPEVLAAARQIVHNAGHACIVSIWQLLDELTNHVGTQFKVTPEMHQLLDLIEALWADPHVDQVPATGEVEFAWNEAGRRDDCESEFHTMLREKLRARINNNTP